MHVNMNFMPQWAICFCRICILHADASLGKIMFLIAAVPSPSISCEYEHPAQLSM